MRKCPNCSSELTSQDLESCPQCAFPLGQRESKHNQIHENDDLDFVVTEAPDSGPELVGGAASPSDDQDDLAIQSSSDLMDEEAQTRRAEDASPVAREHKPIGASEPPLPPEPVEQQLAAAPLPTPDSDQDADEHVPGLTRNADEKVAGAEDVVPTPPADHSSYLNDREKEELLRKIGQVDSPTPPPSKPKTDRAPVAATPPPTPERETPAKRRVDLPERLPSPKMAAKGRGVAYFYRNYIQLVGHPVIKENDDIELNGRVYELKPKKLQTPLVLGAAAAVFAIVLVFVGSLFLSDAGDGQGEIMGIALDDFGRPYVQGATVRLPELSLATKTNPQGFFSTGAVPNGAHQIEYRVGGETVKIEYATVVDGGVTMVTLRPEPPEEPIVSEEELRQAELAAAQLAAEEEAARKTAKKKPSKPKTSKLALIANVAGARLSLDGSVLGAGNLTYSRLKPGKHKYSVEADGHVTKSGTLTLRSGRTYKLEVSLELARIVPKEERYSAEDFFSEGSGFLADGQLDSAEYSFSQALKKRSTYAAAYLSRATVYEKKGFPLKAHDDFLNGAREYRNAGDYNRSITAYNRAIQMDDRSLKAHLGRGNLYISRGEAIAAMADFETAKEIDKKSAAARYGLGEARFQQSNYKKAINHFKDAKKLDSRNPLIHQYLTLCYLARSDKKNVRKSFSKFMETATEQIKTRFQQNEKYAEVIRIVEED